MQTTSGGRRYETPVRVRWSDLDAFGHVNNARTATLLEEARVDWLFVSAADHGIDGLTEGMVVSELWVKYRRQIQFGAAVTVAMWVSSLQTASFTVRYDVMADGRLAAEASTVLVPVDREISHPRRLTAAERDYLAQFLPVSA